MKNWLSNSILLTGMVCVTACSGVSPKVVSRIADVDASGVVDSPFSGDEQVTTTRIENGSGYAIQVFASKSDLSAGVYVGRVDGSKTGATLREGNATYDGNWDAVAVKDAFSPKNRTELADTGTITLTADFDNGTLTGNSTGLGSGESLEIKGDIDGRNVTGTATYADIDGEIDGRIGKDRTYGVFHDDSNGSFMGGGWLATPTSP